MLCVWVGTCSTFIEVGRLGTSVSRLSSLLGGVLKGEMRSSTVDGVASSRAMGDTEGCKRHGIAQPWYYKSFFTHIQS